MKPTKLKVLVLVLGSGISLASATLVTTGHSAADLATGIAGSGITISNATYTGHALSSGKYTGSTIESQGQALLESGIVLSSGNGTFLSNGSNTSDGITLNTGTSGDADLNALIPGFTTFDAAVLEFDFVAAGSGDITASFWYVFGSDEYNEWVGSSFNDVFGFYVDGVNVATLPGTSTPVAINTVNSGSNASFYNNNDPGPFATEMDGFTTPLFVQFDVQAGTTHHMKLAIADAGDRNLDSWVMIGGQSFTNQPPEQPAVPEPATLGLFGAGLLGLAGLARRRKK